MLIYITQIKNWQLYSAAAEAFRKLSDIDNEHAHTYKPANIHRVKSYHLSIGNSTGLECQYQPNPPLTHHH